MNELEKHAEKLMAIDPLAVAEKAVGSDAAVDVAFGLMQALNSAKRDVFDVLGDTCQSTYAATMEILGRHGFQKVFVETFQVYEKPDEFSIWWHPEGILITTESYLGASLNSSTVYYNWAPRVPVMDAWKLVHSGGFRDKPEWVWVGHSDGREGMMTHLKRLRENGAFLAQWKEQPFLWLLNYGETKEPGYDYEAINRRKIEQLPAEVQIAILGE